MSDITPISIPATIVVRDLAAKLGLPVTTVTTELIKNGIMSSMNEQIDFSTASIIAEDLGKPVVLQSDEEAEATEEKVNYFAEDPSAKLVSRPPVVVVIGHVDHGKTSLLDAIRGTDVTGGEAGGITQHIGAYQITKNKRLVTFVDTPGHEAFTQMRARGAKVADVAILVVAADDGVKPQTKESIKIVQDAGVHFVVAITKIDKPEANPDKVKKELSELGINPEEWGGQIPFVAVSAKNGQGIDDLLEAVLLVSDVEQEGLKVNATRAAVGTIIESHVDPKQGPIASVLIQTGTLKVSDDVVVGQVWGKIRSMKNDRGELIKQAPPSTPVQILGLKAAPQVGDVLRVDAAAAIQLKKTVKSHQLGHHSRTVVSTSATAVTAAPENDEEKIVVKKLFVILKTDTLGSAEAILEAIKKIRHPEVSVEIVQRGLGLISETDVLRAESAKAAVYGFHVDISPKAEELAKTRDVSLQKFTVIYDLLNDIIARLEALLPPLEEEEELGQLKVLAVFRNENTFQVVGGKVLSGTIEHGAIVKVLRGEAVVAKGTITQLQANKQNVKSVNEGSECGMKIEGATSIAAGDTIVASRIKVTPRKIDQVA